MSALKALLLLMCTVSLFAQGDQDDQTGANSEPAYAGPSVLSRGIFPSGSGGRAIHFRPYIGVNGVYQTGLTGLSRDSSGHVIGGDSEGVDLAGGISGSESWRRTSLSVNYQGDIRHYVRQSYYDGTNQSLSLELTQRLARRLSMHLGTSAGTYSTRFGYSAPAGYYDPLFTPTNGNTDLFDNRVIFGQVMGRLVYQKSARLSFSFSGGAFLTRRRSTALFGYTGESAGADAIYRLTRSVSIGADYGYSHYGFLGLFGSSDIHSGSADLSVQLSKKWQLSLRAGVFRAENLLLAVVPVDPLIAAITGQTSGIVATYNIHYSPLINGRLSRSFRVGNCSVGFVRGTTPGNGIYLTSRQDGADAGCSYSGQRYWSFSVSAGYYSLTALEQSVAQYRTLTSGGVVTRSLGRKVHAVAQVGLLHFLTKYPGVVTDQYFSASVGLAYSPGDYPLALW